MEQVDMPKRNKALRELVGGEIATGYKPHQVLRTLQEHQHGPEAQQTLITTGDEYM